MTAFDPPLTERELATRDAITERTLGTELRTAWANTDRGWKAIEAWEIANNKGWPGRPYPRRKRGG